MNPPELHFEPCQRVFEPRCNCNLLVNVAIQYFPNANVKGGGGEENGKPLAPTPARLEAILNLQAVSELGFTYGTNAESDLGYHARLCSFQYAGDGFRISRSVKSSPPLRNVRLVVLSLLANFILMPLGALVLAALLKLDQPLGVGLLLLGSAAGAPFLPKLAQVLQKAT